LLDTGTRSGLPLRTTREPEADFATQYQFRAGGYVLSLFSTNLHRLVLKALAQGPKRLAELQREVGGPAQTTLRGNLRNLIGMGVLEKRQSDGRGSLVDHVLTPAGSELLQVSDALDDWLARAPQGPIPPGSETGKAAVKALIGGWGSTMLRALAARPLSLTELDNLITAFSYPALERRLAAMRLAGFVTAVDGNGGGTPYAVNAWLRSAMAPLLAAVRCERRHMAAETAPLTRIDIETILLLVVPRVALGAKASGAAQLAVDAGGRSSRSAGIWVAVEDGRVVRSSSKLESSPESWVRGSAADWLDALVDGRTRRLSVGGDRALTLDLVESVHSALFSG
jgi:DNA-binding HxlR family transcriptional regulator